jgi:hypothetical protein
MSIYIATDLTVLQIWTLLLNGRVRISVLPTQRFSEYTGQRNINPLLRNVYKQNAYFRGNEYIEKPLLKKRNRGRIVELPQQRDGLTNAASNPWTRCSLSSPEDLPKGVDFNSQKLVSQLPVSIQEQTDRRQKRSKDSFETRHQRVRIHCKRDCNDD